MEVQIKSKERVKARGEVFTADREVQAMLDLIPEEQFKSPFTKFLEPACGNGNFMLAIFRKKMKQHDGMIEADVYALQIISNLYAIEIDEENIIEARARMLKCLEEEVASSRKPQFLTAAKRFLDTNIVQGDFLRFDMSRFSAYEWIGSRYVILNG